MIIANKHILQKFKSKVIILLLVLNLCTQIFALKAQVPEYKVKASFFEKIPRYISWPTSTNVQDLSKPFIISIIGKNPFKDELNKRFETLKILGKPVEIRQITKLSEIEGSHILFISSSERSRLTGILNFTKDKPILTISDTDGFCEIGVLVNMYINEEDLVRFEINETKMKLAGFKVEIYLLEVSRIVNQLNKR